MMMMMMPLSSSNSSSRKNQISCVANENGVSVDVRSENEEDVDAYEISIATYPLANTIAAKRVRKVLPSTVVQFSSALENQTYSFSVRSHKKSSNFYSPGNWIEDNTTLECLNNNGLFTEYNKPRINSYPRMIVVRESEFTNEIDYLANHDSGDFVGDASFLTVTATNQSNQSIVNVSFVNSTFTQYCVEYIPASLSFFTRNGNQSFFADYVSCNFQMPITPSTPYCICQCWADRSIAGNGSEACTRKDNSTKPCEWKDTGRSCTCPCTSQGMIASKRYIGMMPVFMSDSSLVEGSWYSHPNETECLFEERLGDDSGCTWKIVGSDVRVVRGKDLLRSGFQVNYEYKDEHEVIMKNAAAMRLAFESVPLKPFICV